MTAASLPLLRRVQILLNTLVGEHHIRRPLLREVRDLTATAGGAHEAAHAAVLGLLAALDEDDDLVDFDASIERISQSLEASQVVCACAAVAGDALTVGG
jgi:hypothetical protein